MPRVQVAHRLCSRRLGQSRSLSWKFALTSLWQTSANPLQDVVSKDSNEPYKTTLANTTLAHVEQARQTAQAAQNERRQALETSFAADYADMIDKYYDYKQPAETLTQVCNLQYQLTSKNQWNRLANTIQQDNNDEIVIDFYRKIAEFTASGMNDNVLHACKVISREDPSRLSRTLAPDSARKYNQYADAINEARSDLHNPKSAQLALYQIVGLANEQAKLLGHASVMDQHFSNAAFISRENILNMLDDLQERLQPHINKLTTSSPVSSPLSDLLSSSGRPAGAKIPVRTETGVKPLLLQEYVTLDGALSVLFEFIQAKFGISIEKDSTASSTEIGLYHAHDQSGYLGSFILDALARHDKTERAFTMQIVNADKPLVYLSTSIEPPTWDTDPTSLSYAQVEAVWHEVGHVLQYLSDKDSVIKRLPIDLQVSEILPKVSE
jgi:Peptidase family M3